MCGCNPAIPHSLLVACISASLLFMAEWRGHISFILFMSTVNIWVFSTKCYFFFISQADTTSTGSIHIQKPFRIIYFEKKTVFSFLQNTYQVKYRNYKSLMPRSLLLNIELNILGKNKDKGPPQQTFSTCHLQLILLKMLQKRHTQWIMMYFTDKLDLGPAL